MLPESKDEFPKLLSLDQNKWIDLSRAHYGRPNGESFRDALIAVRKAVERGRIVVPISWINVTEMNADPIPERRERLSQFMVDLSCNRSILSFITVRPYEVRNAVHAFFGHSAPIMIRRSLVRNGISHALGLKLKITGSSANLEDEVLRYLESSHASEQCLLVYGEDRSDAEQLRGDEIATLEFQEQVRTRSAAEITLEQRRIAELFDHIRRGDVGKSLVATLQEIDVSIPTFFNRFANAAEFIQFFASIRTLDLSLTLTLARDQDLVRRIDRNDSRDLMGLSVAIPYSNLVVTEKYWCHVARSRRLDRKYGTTIITDARELPARLTDMGCL